jgi:hypothetical protein
MYNECDVLLFKTIVRFLTTIRAFLLSVTMDRPVGSFRNGTGAVTLQLIIPFFDVSTEFAVTIPVILCV